MKLILIRHGKDDARYRGGWSRLPLIDQGRRQANQTANYILKSKQFHIGYILSSDLVRCLETSMYFSDVLKLPIHQDKRLREINNGDLAGMHNDDASAKYPGLFFNSLEMDEPYPNGESPSDFLCRVKVWFDEILANPPFSNPNRDILVITHGGVINIIYHLVEKKQWSNQLPSVPIAPCSIHILNTNTMKFEEKNTIVWEP